MSEPEKPQSRLDKLKAKQDQLAKQIKNLESRETERRRKEDTRRCVIAGRYILKHAELNPGDPLTRKLTMLLDEYLVPEEKRPLAVVNRDRALYAKLGIKPLAPSAPANDPGSLKPRFEASKE